MATKVTAKDVMRTMEQLVTMGKAWAALRDQIADQMADLSDSDPLDKQIRLVDKTFYRKLYHYTGDITPSRFVTLHKKLTKGS
jgi:hypothetical protein